LWQLVTGQDDNKHRDLQKGRYNHYKSGSGKQYKNYRNRNETSYSSLTDIWLCLACAMGWTVWLVSVTRSYSTNSGVGSSLFEEKESKQVIGNVLQVTLGEDPDGTGIPVYHALVDYVVENFDEPDQAPLQVRKCFTTGVLFEEGFANVKVLVLLEDPTTSILLDDFVKDRTARSEQQLEPPDMVYSTMVHLIAAILIITSLIGAIHAYFRLDPQQMVWGKVSLAVGTLLIYPVARLIYLILDAGYRWITPLIERPGVIIFGDKTCWDHTRCGVNLDPMDVMMGSSFDAGILVVPSSPSIPGTGKSRLASRRKRRGKSSLPDVMELSSVTSNSIESESEHQHEQQQQQQQQEEEVKKAHSRYPNAGCGFGNFNVLLPMGRREGVQGSFDRDKDAYNLAVESLSSISSCEAGAGMNHTGISTTRRKIKSHDSALSSSTRSVPMPVMDESDYDLAGATTAISSEGHFEIRPRSLDQHETVVVGEYQPPVPLLFPTTPVAGVTPSSARTPVVSNVRQPEQLVDTSTSSSSGRSQSGRNVHCQLIEEEANS
jgi:hypothetical protein